MDKILDMMAKWEPFGQGLFFLIVTGMFFTAVSYMWVYLVILFRGYPPPGSPVPKLPRS